MNKNLSNHRRFWIFLIMSTLILVASYIANDLSISYLLKHNYNKGPILPDIILDNIPYYDVSIIVDFTMVASVLLYIIYLFLYRKFDELPYLMLLFSAFEFLRAICIILTPMSKPCIGDQCVFGWLYNEYAGLFPSGHLAISYLFNLYFLHRKNVRKIGFLMIILTLINAICIMLARGHYTIDLVGTFFIGYTVFIIFELYFKKRILNFVKK